MKFAHPDFSDIHTRTKEFLALPREYFATLDGVRWSDKWAGLNFSRPHQTLVPEIVTNEQIAQFVEGFASQRDLPPFALIVHWIMRVAYPPPTEGPLKRLRVAFVESGEYWRNAGALAGMMSADLPDAVHAVPAEMISARLRHTAFPLLWFTGLLNGNALPGEVPPCSPLEFEAHIGAGLQQLSDADLRSWFETGRGPLVRAGQALVVPPPPRSWSEIVDEALAQPRLVGVRQHIDQLSSALAVPPRRREPQRLPMGGYADVVTHGAVDHLLPSQHALDELDFLRRFTENELLFFRREEPPAQTRDEIAVVLDQGVRTWGDVRLVLTAAATVLAKRARAKAIPMQFSCTSRLGLWTLDDLTAKELAKVLEASDLSQHPGLALERVLETPALMPRDVFLLTHPFALSEENVQSAARRIGPLDRLFALTVNGDGDAELHELRRGLPVRLRTFRIDFNPATTPAAMLPKPTSKWIGPVERFGWPFPICPNGPIQFIAFDDAGERVLTVHTSGMLCVWDLATARCQPLPRPYFGSKRIQLWKAAVGVANGFALLARQASRYVIVHYDFETRVCSSHLTPDTGHVEDDTFGLHYLRRQNAVVVFHGESETPICVMELVSQMSFPRDDKNIRQRATLRHLEQLNCGPVRTRLSPAQSEAEVGSHQRRSYFVNRRGEVCIADILASDSGEIGTRRWPNFLPKTNGQPTYVGGGAVHDVQLAGDVLAILSSGVTSDSGASCFYLHFFRGPDGHFLKEQTFVGNAWKNKTLLSRDGKYVAVAIEPERFEVHDTAGSHIFRKKLDTNAHTRLWVGDDGFLLQCGIYGYSWHLVEWLNDFIVHSETNRQVIPKNGGFQNPALERFIRGSNVIEAQPTVGADPLAEPERSKSGVRRNGLWLVLDQYGQVMAFNSNRELVFQFYAVGDSWSAWLPDGTRCGRGPAHHGPIHPLAPAKFGRTLRQASQERLT